MTERCWRGWAELGFSFVQLDCADFFWLIREGDRLSLLPVLMSMQPLSSVFIRLLLRRLPSVLRLDTRFGLFHWAVCTKCEAESFENH